MYYKVVRKNMTFEEAIEAFNKGEIIRYKQGKPLCPSETKDIEDIGFTIEQIHSNDWVALAVDNNMEDLKRQVDYMVHEMGVEIDTRFYKEEYMNISSYWHILNDIHFFDDNLIYEIIKWIFDNKKYKSNRL